MSHIQNTIIGTARTLLGWVPDGWLPSGEPDPLVGRESALGQPTSRLDGAVKVAGAARFAAEVPLDRMVYAALVHSPVTRARINAIDTAAAAAAPGVVLVLTHANMPPLGTPALIGGTDMTAAGNSALPILQKPEVRYNGQVVAAVLAETQEQADHAASLIEVDYARLAAQTRFNNAKVTARTPPSVLFDKNHVRVGNPEQELEQSAFRVDQIYQTPTLNHAAMEPHGVTVAWNGDSLLVHDATQGIAPTAMALAKLFGLKPDQVRVLSPFVGGGFGSKGLWDHQIIAVAAARMLGRPVRLALKREGVFRMVGGRSPSEQRLALGADREGNFTALIHTGYSVMPPYATCPEPYSLGSRSAYRARSFEFIQHFLDLDIVPNTFMRAPGEAIGTFALESAIDELAHAMGIDPVELRLRNEPEKHPVSGAAWSQHDARKAWLDGAERFGWSRRSALQPDGEWLRGMGCGGGSFPYARVPGNSVRLTLSRDGKAHLACSAQEMGMGTATVQTQHAADRLGLPIHQVTFELGDSSLPTASMAGGSTGTVSVASAVAGAAQKLLAELLGLAKNGPLAGLRPADCEFARGGIRSRKHPARHESFGALLARAGRDEITVLGTASAPLEFFKYAMHSTAAVFCEVRVSAVSGEIRVDRLLGSYDCGAILNPKTAASQLRGGLIMGLGQALTEEVLFDPRSGRIMNPSLADYHIPTHLDVPPIEVMWTGIPDPRTPLGARGIGEVSVTGVAAAIANAVFHATGKRIRRLPITLDQLLEATPG